MDLQEWEYLPDNDLLEIHDNRGKQIFYASQFVDSTTEHTRVPNQLVVPLPIQLQASLQKPLEDDEEVTKEVITEIPNPGGADEQDQASQVFFKKMKESDFENMKLDSPKFNNNNKTFVPHIDDKVEVLEAEKENMIKKRETDIEEEKGGLNLWNWSLTGLGVICSFGVAAAAATIFIFIGNQTKQRQNKLNQKLKFQFPDDKKIKQVVHLQPTKLNETTSGVRGIPRTKKSLTVEGLLLSSLEQIQECFYQSHESLLHSIRS